MVVEQENETEELSGDDEHSMLLSEDLESQELCTVLLGMGLKREELLLFTERNMTLEKFLRLTDEDLQHVGITDSEKRKALLLGINTLGPNKENGETKEAASQELLSHQDFLTVLANSSDHLKTLCKTMSFIQRQVEEIGLNQFLNGAVSARHVLAEVAGKGVEQVDQVHYQLEALQSQVKQHHKCQIGRKKVRNGHLITIFLTSTTLLCVLLWKIRSRS